MVGPPQKSHGPKFALRTLSRLILIPALPFFWCLTPSPASKYLNARYVYVFNNASGLLLSWLKKVLIAYEVYARNTHQVRITSIPRSGSSELLLLLCVFLYVSVSLYLELPLPQSIRQFFMFRLNLELPLPQSIHPSPSALELLLCGLIHSDHILLQTFMAHNCPY